MAGQRDLPRRWLLLTVLAHFLALTPACSGGCGGCGDGGTADERTDEIVEGSAAQAGTAERSGENRSASADDAATGEQDAEPSLVTLDVEEVLRDVASGALDEQALATLTDEATPRSVRELIAALGDQNEALARQLVVRRLERGTGAERDGLLRVVARFEEVPPEAVEQMRAVLAGQQRDEDVEGSGEPEATESRLQRVDAARLLLHTQGLTDDVQAFVESWEMGAHDEASSLALADALCVRGLYAGCARILRGLDGAEAPHVRREAQALLQHYAERLPAP